MDQRKQILDQLYRQLIVTVDTERLLTLATIQENEMDQATTDLIVRLNTATNNVASRIKRLIDQAQSAGAVSFAEVDAALSPVVSQLEAMGTDPSNPVPATA